MEPLVDGRFYLFQAIQKCLETLTTHLLTILNPLVFFARLQNTSAESQVTKKFALSREQHYQEPHAEPLPIYLPSRGEF